MTNTEVVAARPLNGSEAQRLYLLELARDEGLPAMMTRLSYQGQTFLVAGLVDYGDGKGPIALGLLQPELER